MANQWSRRPRVRVISYYVPTESPTKKVMLDAHLTYAISLSAFGGTRHPSGPPTLYFFPFGAADAVGQKTTSTTTSAVRRIARDAAAAAAGSTRL